jgi:hypothetical protein
MSEPRIETIVDQMFPIETDEIEHVLSGLPDCACGYATKYFSEMDRDDREIVQWYLMQGVTPVAIEEYTSELVTGYAHVDPQRTAHNGIQAAHRELIRVARYLDLFFSSNNFFPRIDTFSQTVTNDQGRYDTIIFRGWANFAHDTNEGFSLKWYKDLLMAAHTTEYIRHAEAFIDDPHAVPHVFNQDLILRHRTEAQESL